MPDRVPVWLLDIDGVLAPFPTYGGDPEIWDSWLPAGDRGYAEATIAEPVRDFLVHVHEHGLAEIRWHTTWQDEAVNIFGPKFNLPVFPVQAAPEFEKRMTGMREPIPDHWWKFAAAQRVLQEERRPLLWTDDDLDESRASKTEQENPGSSMLLVCPDRTLGLTPRHLDMIASFLTCRR